MQHFYQFLRLIEDRNYSAIKISHKINYQQNMKKIIGYIFSLLLALSLVSCFGNEFNPEDDLTIPGKLIYSNADLQHKLALDPFDMVFRFNVLLTEASQMDPEPASLEDVYVSSGGEEVQLARILFQNATFVNGEQGSYQIVFTGSLQNTYTRDGIITVNTGGKLLHELSGEDAWTISLKGKNYSTFRYLVKLNEGGSAERNVTDGSFGIFAGGEPNSWDIKISEYAITDSRYTAGASKWSGEYKLTQTVGKELLTFKNARESTYEFTGSGTGRTIFGTHMKYEIYDTDPMVYIPGCSNSESSNFLQSGKVETSYTSREGIFDVNMYPSLTSSVEWVKGTKNCEFTMYINYNGIREEFQ